MSTTPTSKQAPPPAKVLIIGAAAAVPATGKCCRAGYAPRRRGDLHRGNVAEDGAATQEHGPTAPGDPGQLPHAGSRHRGGWPTSSTPALTVRSSVPMPGSTGQADRTVAEWRRAGERLDAERAIACLADEVVLISPLTAQFTFHGRAQVATMLRAALTVITAIRYHTEIGDDQTRALFYYGRCGGQEFEEAQLLRLNDQAHITEITLFGRPLPGLTAIMARIGPVILRLQGRPRLARVMGMATLPLHVMAVSGEQRLVPLADPGRSARTQPS